MPISNEFNNKRIKDIQSQYENFAYNACKKIYGDHNYNEK